MSDANRPQVHPGTADDVPSLQGVRICLVFEHSLSHYTRILEEVRGLLDAGASVRLLTSFRGDDLAPFGIPRVYAPLEPPNIIPASQLRVRLLRIADNLMRSVVRKIAGALRRRGALRKRLATLRELARETDIFWVVDFPSLPTAHSVARSMNVRLVYETVDLVPEYRYKGERWRRRALSIERAILPELDGFITASESYADYYVETYGDVLPGRPMVRDNMPAQIVARPRRTQRPIRLLFLGSLMFDRPVMELITAMSLVSSDVTLTFQGKNYLGDEPLERVRALGLEERVLLLGPCAPQEIVPVAAEYDVGVVALRGIDENERRASTSKLFTYMSAGLVVLGSDLPGISRIVMEHQNGMLVPGMSPEEWARAIDALANMDDQSLDAMRARSLNAARPLAWDAQRPAFLSVFRQALTGRPGPRPVDGHTL